MKIGYQQQPSKDSCACACLAMVHGRPVAEVVAEFHEKFMKGSTLSGYLKAHSIEHRRCYTDESIVGGSLYICIVPSLNLKGIHHNIIVDARMLKDDTLTVLDPNKGREDTNYYTWYKENSKGTYAHVVKGIVPEIEILVSGGTDKTKDTNEAPLPASNLVFHKYLDGTPRFSNIEIDRIGDPSKLLGRTMHYNAPDNLNITGVVVFVFPFGTVIVETKDGDLLHCNVRDPYAIMRMLDSETD